MSALRVGIIGAGFAGSSHIEAVRRLPGVIVAGVSASTPERSREAAARFAVESAFEDFRALVASEEIDAVHNCAPNHLHFEVNRAVLQAGKHLLSEKPLALDSAQTAALVELARSTDAVAAVCHNYRHYPLVRQAKALLEAGDVGDPFLIHGTYLQDWLLYRDDWNWRLETEQSGRSRATADIGSHWLDLAQYVTGTRVRRVCARLSSLHRERLKPHGPVQTFERAAAEGTPTPIATEDAAHVLLEFYNGATGVLCVSQVSPGRKNHLTLNVDTPSVGLAWDQEDPNRLWVGRRDAANAQLMRDPGLLVPDAARLAHYPGGHEEGWPDGLKNLVVDFYDAVRAAHGATGHEPSFATFEDAHQVTRVVEAIVESSESDRWVEIGGG